MTITTAYDLSEPLFFLDKNNKIQCKPVYRIDIERTQSTTKIQYWFNTAPEGQTSQFIIIDSNKVFTTKEKLIQSLEP
jgi:hypothetical protein